MKLLLAVLCVLTQTPSGLRIPDGQTLLFTAHAEGVQIYESKAKANDPTAFEWVLKGPEANLFDSDGHKIGKHYAGPTWELNDGSKVQGNRVSSTPASHAEDVPWLLLQATFKSTEGLLGKVSYVMRVDTHGGVPSKPPTKAGQEVKVRYKATYVFLTNTAASSSPEGSAIRSSSLATSPPAHSPRRTSNSR